MGKRELMLVGAFVIVGVLMYQLTAAPPPPGSNRVSVRSLLDHVRREVRGNRSNAEATSVTTHAVGPAVTELRLRLGRGTTLTIVGEARQDVEINLKVWSNGYDDAEARKLAQQSVGALKMDDAGVAMIATVTYPDPGQQRPTATVKVPTRLKVRVENAGALTASDLDAVELAPTGGDTTIKNVSGSVIGNHRGGRLVLEHVGTVKLTVRGSEVQVTDAKELTLTINGGSLTGNGVSGAVEVESHQADLKLSNLEATKGPVRVNAVGGTLTMDGLRSDARIDGRNTQIDVNVGQAAPIAIYNEGGAEIRITPPAGGYQIDALARDGGITPADVLHKLGIEQASSPKEARATGAVGGGGPTITLRSNRGGIVFKTKEDTRTAEIEKK